jgi:ganglioside GM2 activator
MEKNVIGLWIKVPCEHNVGSCTYRDICTNMNQVFPTFFETYDDPKKCPSIPPAIYSVSNLVMDVTKSLPSIADGEFRITIDLLSNSAGQLGCLQLDVNLTG